MAITSGWLSIKRERLAVIHTAEELVLISITDMFAASEVRWVSVVCEIPCQKGGEVRLGNMFVFNWQTGLKWVDVWWRYRLEGTKGITLNIKTMCTIQYYCHRGRPKFTIHHVSKYLSPASHPIRITFASSSDKTVDATPYKIPINRHCRYYEA